MGINNKESELKSLGKRVLVGGLAALISECLAQTIKKLYSRLNVKYNVYPSFHPYIIAYQSLQFALYHYLKRIATFKDDTSLSKSMKYLGLGGVVGVIKVAIASPLYYHYKNTSQDAIHIQKMKRQGESKIKIMKYRMFKIYKGFFLASISSFTYHSIYYGLYDIFKSNYRKKHSIEASDARKVLFSIVTTISAAIISLPINVLRKASLTSHFAIPFDYKKEAFISLKNTMTITRICSLTTLYLFDKLQQMYNIASQ